MDGSYCVKPLKQKQVVNILVFSPPFLSLIVLLFFNTKYKFLFMLDPWDHLTLLCFFSQVDGVSYLLQEIYGIENKYNSQESKVEIKNKKN